MEPILTLDRISGHRLWAVTPHSAVGQPVLACRDLAVGIATPFRSFLGRCDSHDGHLTSSSDFQEAVDRSLRRRYGVGARLRGEVAAECC